MVFAISIINNYNLGDTKAISADSVEMRDETNLKSPKKSGPYTESFIYIDGNIPDIWALTAANNDWCYSFVICPREIGLVKPYEKVLHMPYMLPYIQSLMATQALW